MASLSPQERIAIPRGAGELVAYRYGDAGGRPLIAIHGITSSHLAWQFLAAPLVARGFTVYAVDLRGRGDSRSVGAPYGMATHADDVVALMDHVGLATADVIGHSMGAFVAAALVHAHPDRVARLTFIDGGVPLPLPPGMTLEQVMPLVLGPALERLSKTFASQEEYRAYWRDHPALQRAWGPEIEAYVAYDLRGDAPVMRPATDPEAVTRDSEDVWGGDLIATALTSLDRDVVLIRAIRGLQNEEMPLYPEVVLPYVAAQYPRVHVRTVDDTNHYDLVMSDYGAAACVDVMAAEGVL